MKKRLKSATVKETVVVLVVATPVRRREIRRENHLQIEYVIYRVVVYCFSVSIVFYLQKFV